jgi:2-polyprenyl-3-methyl-5-hydroxy-6-metoxy-1,4-benzoquinol methylase
MNKNLVYVKCDLCGSDEYVQSYKRTDGMIIVKCKNCGLHYINPRFEDKDIESMYDLNYFRRSKHIFQTIIPLHYYLFLDALLADTQEKIDMISQEFDLNSKRILDIGCASGEFSFLAHKYGAIVTGIDISDEIIKIARRRYPHIDFRVCTINKLPEPESFDAIFAFEVLEHVSSPRLFLMKAKKHLRNGGILVFSTPNIECGKSVGFDNWAGTRKSFEHLYFFSPQVLMKYAEKIDLKVHKYYTGQGKGIYIKKNFIYEVRILLRTIAQKMVFIRTLFNFFKHIIYHKNIQNYQIGGNSHSIIMILHNT